MGVITQPTRGGSSSSPQVAEALVADTTGLSPRETTAQKVLRIVLTILKWIAISVLALFTALLIAVSLVWGPTHWAIGLVLVAAWAATIALLVVGPRLFGRWRTQLSAALSFMALGLLTVLLSQYSAYTPPIVDAQGNTVPGSIASLEKVNLNGHEEWISIRGKNTNNPVLLFLAGGPGGSQLAAVRHTLGQAGLEDHFVVVNWEQPGSGKSFEAVDRSKLKVEDYISDGHQLVLQLQQRFGQKKVYVVGESWGSALGIMLVQRYPEQFYAFMGTGQMVDFTECDLICYNWAIQWAQQRGDTGKVAQLKAQGPPPYYGNDVAMKEANYLLDTFTYMNENPEVYQGNTNTFQDILSPEYGLYDKANWLRGVLDTLNHVMPQLWGVNFRTQAAQLQVPVYFLIGRYDVNAPVSLTEDYYQVLSAPHKEIVWFEHSGHGPWNSESAKFLDVIVNKVLPETYKR